MTTASQDASGEKGGDATAAPAKQRRRHRLADVAPVRRESDELSGWPKIMAVLLRDAMRGEIGTVMGRWRTSSLAELRQALDAAIETAARAGDTDVHVGPLEVVLAHYPRGEGKPYRISISSPARPVDDAQDG